MSNQLLQPECIHKLADFGCEIVCPTVYTYNVCRSDKNDDEWHTRMAEKIARMRNKKEMVNAQDRGYI